MQHEDREARRRLSLLNIANALSCINCTRKAVAYFGQDFTENPPHPQNPWGLIDLLIGATDHT